MREGKKMDRMGVESDDPGGGIFYGDIARMLESGETPGMPQPNENVPESKNERIVRATSSRIEHEMERMHGYDGLPTAERLIEMYGYWGDHQTYPRSNWSIEVADEDTLQGYWEWVADSIREFRGG